LESNCSDPLIINISNSPNIPNIEGSKSGKVNILYTYNFTSIDPDNDQVYFIISWDDGSPEETIGPFQSGEEGSAKHRWTSQYTYYIRAKARDIHGAESNWVEYEVIITKKTKAINTPFIQFLQRFPLLQTLLQRLGLQI
jgi:hypothetical protein